MKSNFIENTDTEKEFWLTPQEMARIPGMPDSVPGIHYRANMQGWVKRKKEGVKGGKAVEYNVMSLPEDEKNKVIKYLQNDILEAAKDMQQDTAGETPEPNNRLASALATLVAELEPEEAQKALKILSKGGLSALMPNIFDNKELYSLMGASRQSIQTLMLLESLPAEARREILSRYGINEQSDAVAPKMEPRTKAG